jgi:sugar lactone lactonase YvrE
MNTRWEYKGFTVAGGNGAGYGPHQLNNPQGLYVDDDQTVYIADEKNYRIVAWKRDVTSGQVAAGLNGKGKRTDQFNDPRYVIGNKKKDSIFISDTYNKRVMRWLRENGTSGETIISEVSCSGLTMDDNGFLYITDIDKHEVRRYQEGQTSGVVVAGGNGKGSGLNQLSYPTYVFVDQESSVYVSDEYNHRVMKWEKDAKEGIIVAGGDGYGYGLTQLYNPQGVIVDQWGTVYVADMYNHRIMRWPKGTPQGNIIAGGNNKGGEANQLNSPKGLSFDRQGNLYVVDNGNYRVQKFNINPSSCS